MLKKTLKRAKTKCLEDEGWLKYCLTMPVLSVLQSGSEGHDDLSFDVSFFNLSK